MSLANTSRPKKLDEIYGNKATVKSLKSIIESNNMPHVFLFTGPTGCGKTTLARILASSIDENEKAITTINSSHDTGVESARRLIGELHYAPMESEKKIYILDEVHNTSPQFQDALLEKLEEPPGHVYFILCTTDPQKLKKALIGRCTHFTVDVLKKPEMFNMLESMCKKNDIKLTQETHSLIFDAIYEESEGGPRRAIKILEQIKDMKEVTQKEVVEFIKSGNSDIDAETIEICRALFKNGITWNEMAEFLKKFNGEPESARRAILGYAQSVLFKSGNKKAAIVIEYFKNHFYDIGKPGLTLACFKVLNYRG